MKKRQKRRLLPLVIEFIKVQVAGNILFIGTLAGTAIGEKILHYDSFVAFMLASILSNILYFTIDRQWVFRQKSSKRKGHRDIMRFILFAIVNFAINILLVMVFMVYGVNAYLSQLLAGIFFAVWSYIGLKFWVFAPSRHHALTVESPRKGRRYDHGPKRTAK